MILKIDWVVFDIFGVLIEEPNIIHGVLLEILPDPPEPVHVKEAYRAYTNGEIEKEEFWRRVNADPSFEEKLLERFHFNPEDEAMFRALKERGVRIGIISNVTRPWYEALVRRFNLEAYAEFIEISADVHLSKPARGMFDTFLEKTGAAADGCLFIDDKKRNLASAKQDGFKTCWFERQEDEHPFIPDVRITALHQLLEHL